MTVNEQLKESPRHVSIELKDVRGRRKIMCTLFAIHKESIIVFFFYYYSKQLLIMYFFLQIILYCAFLNYFLYRIIVLYVYKYIIVNTGLFVASFYWKL